VSGLEIAYAPPVPLREGDGDGGFLRRPEVRDVIAWLRLLVDPQDASAVARALARPPVELRHVDLARVIQVARRRKLDLVVGVGAAIESPQVPPEARERIQRFAALHRSVEAELDELAPEPFLDRLIERLGLPRRGLLAPEDAAREGVSLECLRELAAAYLAERPRASTLELVRHLAGVAPSDGGEPAGGPRETEQQQERLQRTLQQLRDELAHSVGRIGGRLGELRLDTDLDISHGVVLYLELLKLSALIQRPEGQDLAEALADINARLLAAATPLQREILQTSTLDQTLLAGEGEAPTRPILAREELSLEAFLPRKGAGLALSASDIQTYRSCPLRYKFARVLRIPTPQTVHQRFGIVVHQVLERYHSDDGQTLEQMLDLLEQVWRRSALGESEADLELLGKARDALTRYHARLSEERAQPVWFERSFSFRLGPHHLRGRVDRVDRLAEDADAAYELIDYKTSRPRSPEDLAEDVQLSLYALAAREDWQLESSRQAYYYVLDDVKVPVSAGREDEQELKEVVLEVGAGILAQRFEPLPSRARCASCDYRVVCPAAAV
jgi:CRISPR/Cas system-associated exonuclease Cas4 (RecB family)